MSVHVTAYVWEHSQHKGTALLLMLAVADIAHKNGVAFPSVATLSRFIRMSERNTQRVLAALERSDELEIKRNAGPHGTHLYRIKMNTTLPLFAVDNAVDKGGDKLTPDNLTGDTQGPRGVTKQAQRGDTATSPEPKEQKKNREKGAAARRTSLADGFAVSDRVRQWAKEKGFERYLPAHFEKFISSVKARGARYVDWDEALMGCIRDDWGDVRRKVLLTEGKREPGAAQAAEWWQSGDGLRAKAGELGIEHADDPTVTPAENFLWLKAKVCAAVGKGPWDADRSETFQRLLHRAREMAHA